MNTKVLLAALAGAVATFLSGWLLYGIALRGFFESNTLEAARGLMRTEPIFWAIFIGCLAWSALLAFVFSKWAGISTFMTGAKAGAWIALLIALGMDFFNYASMDAWTMTATLVDPIVNAVQGAIAGGVVGWVLGYGNRT
ncbi:MAG TPA: hypothetical protein PK228_07930 [Saprospiraceae bacterium]|nr:hypothetical protein [Saprospiraceae bacterium]